jgi:hypothetical protein
MMYRNLQIVDWKLALLVMSSLVLGLTQAK